MKKEKAGLKAIRKKHPVSMNKNQFYRVAHISKATALYLLLSGLVPCIDSGKDEPTISCRTELLNLSSISSERFKEYLIVKFSGAEDLLSIPQVSSLTGYSTKTIYRWCSEKGMKHFRISNKVLIPKIILINYLASEDAYGICRKSAAHLELIQGFLSRYKRIK